MKILKLTATILFMFMLTVQSALCASFSNANFLRIKDLIIDNSDNMVFVRGSGNFKAGQNALQNTVYIPTPGQNQNSVNLINNITTFTITSPARYVIDIPNAVLVGSSRSYKVQNSIIQNIALSQFSANPNIVRIVFTVSNQSDLSKFKTYTNGTDIVVKYAPSIISNSIQYKFYTPSGDSSASSLLQNTSSVLTYNASNETLDLTPRLQTKYYLSQVSQNSDGLILRGIGQIAFERANYNSDNTKATVTLDSASLAHKLDNKTYTIPSSNREIKATLTINKLNSRKVKLTLDGTNLRDYRFVVSPDGQSLFVSHRSYVINTIFSTNTAKVNSYKMTKNANGYSIFDIAFNKSVTYDVFELNDNFYLDVNNLGDFSAPLFESMLKSAEIKVQALKISSDKTRFIIPSKNLNFAYANVESNAKSIKLCFKAKSSAPETKNEITIASSTVDKTVKDDSKSGNINVIYIPKEDDKPKVEKPKKKKEPPTISSMRKVVLDPGHGGADCGAIGGGYYEKTLNLKVAKLVQEKLEKKKVFVYMTRSKDVTLTLEDRVNYSNELNPDIYVSIHTNSTLQEDSYGLETHYFKDDSYDLAQKIHSNFASAKNLKKWETKDRGVIKSRFYVINHTEAPSVLIEMGFISNLNERAKLLTEDRQEEIADAITKGILEYLKVK